MLTKRKKLASKCLISKTVSVNRRKRMRMNNHRKIIDRNSIYFFITSE